MSQTPLDPRERAREQVEFKLITLQCTNVKPTGCNANYLKRKRTISISNDTDRKAVGSSVNRLLLKPAGKELGTVGTEGQLLRR
jgi:hypothetical protein